MRPKRERTRFFEEAPPGPGWRSHDVPAEGARPARRVPPQVGAGVRAAPRAIRVIEEEFGCPVPA